MYRLGERGEISQIESFPFRGKGVTVFPHAEFVLDVTRSFGDIDRNVEEFLFNVSLT